MRSTEKFQIFRSESSAGSFANEHPFNHHKLTNVSSTPPARVEAPRWSESLDRLWRAPATRVFDLAFRPPPPRPRATTTGDDDDGHDDDGHDDDGDDDDDDGDDGHDDGDRDGDGDGYDHDHIDDGDNGGDDGDVNGDHDGDQLGLRIFPPSRI